MNISITGNLGSGKSSVAKILRERGYEIFSTGQVFRQLAMEKGMSVEAFNKQVNEAAAHGDRSVDRMIDDTTARIGRERDNVVFDSRLAWRFAPESFKVFVITDIDEASRRVFHDSLRADSESYESQEACKKSLINRQKLETVRYQKVYGISYYDMGNYNLVIESTSAAPAEIAQEILDRMEEYQQGRFEKMMELNPSSIHIIDSHNTDEHITDNHIIGQPQGGADINHTVTVNEKGGAWTLHQGKALLEEAVQSGIKFIPVKIALSEAGGSDSFMDFSKL